MKKLMGKSSDFDIKVETSEPQKERLEKLAKLMFSGETPKEAFEKIKIK